MIGERDSPGRPWAIKTEGLTKSFGAYPALRGLNLEIEPGKSVVIFGPNGAGKTTLIKILATIMNPSSGTITVDGLNIKSHAKEIRHRIGVVTHQTFLYNNLTAYENLEFYGRMFDVPKLKERVHEIIRLVGMTARLHDRVATLSRGMQQRLSIARALLHKPTIILLDEPETGLDPEAIPLLWDALHNETGRKRTVVLTTHNLERGLELGERLFILDKGKIVYEEAREVLNIASLKKAYRNSTRVST
jgi:heme ABC exporter ATP-binding subunit CcmA|tara:strand:- start:4173 stop:4913 length:741 start_codon:yes stop_codon:yes gene_type:complete